MKTNKLNYTNKNNNNNSNNNNNNNLFPLRSILIYVLTQHRNGQLQRENKVKK
jgi:hypothetical protein